MTAPELSWLFGSSPTSSVFLYDGQSKSVSRAGFEIPWPVLFLLGHRHKKHRYLNKKLPEPCDIISCTTDAVNKLKWMNFYKDADRKPFHRSLHYPRRIKTFEGHATPELEGLCYHLRRALFQSFHRARSEVSRKSKFWANVLNIEKAARDWLALSDFCPIPSDKDGGFVLVDTGTLRNAQLELLSSAWYRELELDFLTPYRWRESILPEYFRVCKQVAAADPRVSLSLLSLSSEGGLAKASSSLLHTCKTHKDPGEVSFRPVHASNRHCFTGLMSWICLVLREVLGRFAHLVDSSDAFIDRIRHCDVAADDILVHLDLKDFFMTGDTGFLVHHCASMVKPSWRTVFRVALTFILDHQYVTSALFPRRCWRVVCGSGMGLRSSSFVANVAFMHAMELMGLMLVHKTHALETYGIKHYFRYVDNLFFVCTGDFVKIRSLVNNVKSTIRPFVGTVEEVSHVGITFLDLNLLKDHHWSVTGKLTFTPYLKPTALLSTLSVMSAHPVGIHEAWMRAYVLRLRDHSSSLVWFRTYKQEVLSRMRGAGIDHAIVAMVERSTEFTEKVGLPVSLFHDRCLARRERSVWIKMPFHPAWVSQFNRCLHIFSVEWQDVIRAQVGGDVASLRAAWQLRMPSLSSVIRRF